MIKVSVLMPVFNESKYIVEALSSVFNQKCDVLLEVIVVDDFSTDNTFEILRKLSLNNKNLKIIRNVSKGKNSAFNLCYENATGDYFILFAGDDILPQNSIHSRLEPLIGKIEPAVSLCKLKMFSEINKFNGIVIPKDPNKGNISGGTMLFNKSFAEIAFPLPCHLANEDMWIVCVLKYFESVSCFHVPLVGIEYRIHDNNSISFADSFEKKNINMNNRHIVFAHFLEKYRSKLSAGQIIELSSLAAAESLRSQGSTLSILFMKNLKPSDKARYLMHSSSFLYFFRKLFFKLLSGRG